MFARQSLLIKENTFSSTSWVIQKPTRYFMSRNWPPSLSIHPTDPFLWCVFYMMVGAEMQKWRVPRFSCPFFKFITQSLSVWTTRDFCWKRVCYHLFFRWSLENGVLRSYCHSGHSVIQCFIIAWNHTLADFSFCIVSSVSLFPLYVSLCSYQLERDTPSLKPSNIPPPKTSSSWDTQNWVHSPHLAVLCTESKSESWHAEKWSRECAFDDDDQTKHTLAAQAVPHYSADHNFTSHKIQMKHLYYNFKEGIKC